MSTDQLFIPEKIKVGFQKREGTYTGKLAYVIYFDNKGKLRKETSWQSWRNKNIEPIEFPNEPTEGFVLNKKVGGVKERYSWNARNEYVRVYDPRDFEFEISIPNLLFILRECDCSRGKGLEGKFVYSWSGAELVLLPATCEDFVKSKKYTTLQSEKIKVKDLVPGFTYLTKKGEPLIYLGKFDYHYLPHPYYSASENISSQKATKYIFWDQKVDSWNKNPRGCIWMTDVGRIARLESDQIVSNFAELVEKYYKSEHGSAIKELVLRKVKYQKENSYHREWWMKDLEGHFLNCLSHLDRDSGEIVYVQHKQRVRLLTVSDDEKLKKILTTETIHETHSFPPGKEKPKNYDNRYTFYTRPIKEVPWIEPTGMTLYIKLESGTEIDYFNKHILDY